MVMMMRSLEPCIHSNPLDIFVLSLLFLSLSHTLAKSTCFERFSLVSFPLRPRARARSVEFFGGRRKKPEKKAEREKRNFIRSFDNLRRRTLSSSSSSIYCSRKEIFLFRSKADEYTSALSFSS